MSDFVVYVARSNAVQRWVKAGRLRLEALVSYQPSPTYQAFPKPSRRFFSSLLVVERKE